MTVQIQRPSGVNVGVNNPGNIVYLIGNENTDGSIRLIPGTDDIQQIQKRENGVWNPTSLELSADSLNMGLGFKLSVASSHLIVAPEGSKKGIVTTTRYDDTGSEEPHSVFLSTKDIRVVVQSDESLEQTLTNHIGVAIVAADAFGAAVYFKTGSIGASAPVLFENTEGIPPNDILFLRKEFPASTFPANTEVKIDIDSGVVFSIGTQVNPKLTSAQPFSILYNAAGIRFWTAVDRQKFTEESIFTYPTGFARILMAGDGNPVSDNSGEFVIKGVN